MDALARRFDTVVVGGGSAGCVVAARLSEHPDRTVCLVEAGPDYGPLADGGWPADMLDARALAFSHAWETEKEDRSQLRARILGGCSAHNACVLLEGAPSDYDEWGHGWSYAAIEPYLRRAERELARRVVRAEELSPWHRAFAEEAGADAILHPVNAVGTVRWSTAFAYVDPARGRPNLTILDRTLVDRIDPDRRRILTDRGDLEAETIVLSAGAYGSPGILLRSGIGPELAHDLPVGEGLTDHVGAGLAWEASARLQRETDAFATERPVFMAQVTVKLREAELFVFPALDPGWEISAAVFVMKPRSRGRVSLLGADPGTPLRIDHGFLSDARDAELLAEGVDATRVFAATPSLRRYATRELRPGLGVEPAEHASTGARGFFHPVGTCAIAEVVDGLGRVRGLEGVHVVDASIMPTIPKANTNLTTVAIAERLAERL